MKLFVKIVVFFLSITFAVAQSSSVKDGSGSRLQWGQLTGQVIKQKDLVTYIDTRFTNLNLTTLLNGKVDKVTGKQLSTEDFTTAYKNNVDANTTARHTHTNKTILDNTTASYTTAEQTKLAGIATGATANSSDSYLLSRTNHTGTQAISTVVGLQDSLTNKVNKVTGKQLSTEDFTTAYKNNVDANTTARHTHTNKTILDNTTASYTTSEQTKLAGIATGATANQTDSYLLSRNNHTGTQDLSTITTTFAVGSIPFSNGSGFSQNNSQLFWNNSNNSLSIGYLNATERLNVNGNIHLNNTAGVSNSIQLLANTSSPFSGKLVFGTDNTGWKFSISKRSSSIITDLFSVQDNGSVGIGTIIPNAKLDIVKDDIYGMKGQMGAVISVRYAGTGIEFGHPNQSGYGSSIGANFGNGNPYIAFNSESGSTSNTFKTRGIIGRVIMNDVGLNKLLISRVATANADNQSLTTDVTIDNNGNVGIGLINPVSKLQVSNGNIEIDNSSNGLILKSSDGTRYLLKVANGGTLTLTAQ